jgi:acetyl esterase/lipase
MLIGNYAFRGIAMNLRTLTLIGLLVPTAAFAQDKTASFVYHKTPDAELKLFVHYPADWKASDRRPGMVFFFGGGWTNGKVEQFQPQAEYFAGRGIVTARADYRVASRHKVTPVDCVDDAQEAVRWMRTNATKLGVDPDKLIASGGSAGGHIAACTYFSSDFRHKDGDKFVSCKPNALVLFNPVLRFSGVPTLEERLKKDEAAARRLSPTLFVSKEMAPTILFFGTTDKLLAQGEEFIAAAKKLGGVAELKTASGEGHGYFNRSPWRERTIADADAFLVERGFLKAK